MKLDFISNIYIIIVYNKVKKGKLIFKIRIDL